MIEIELRLDGERSEIARYQFCEESPSGDRADRFIRRMATTLCFSLLLNERAGGALRKELLTRVGQI